MFYAYFIVASLEVLALDAVLRLFVHIRWCL